MQNPEAVKPGVNTPHGTRLVLFDQVSVPPRSKALR